MRFAQTLPLIAASALPQPALAQVAVADSGDTGWMILCALLVLLAALPGLMLRQAGLVNVRNALSVMTQGAAVIAIVSLVWAIAGYSIAYAPGSAWLGGGANLLLANLGQLRDGMTVPESAFVLFQMALALLAASLLIGAVAERARLGWLIGFAPLWLLLVYAPITHWVWAEGGWLFERGLLDFAGGTVVHITAGVASLVCAVVLGTRTGFGKTPMPPHNMTMTVTGAGMLWVGWFGFNGGSALAADGNASMAMLVTHISAAAGSISWVMMEKIKYGKPSVLGIVTGMVAGLGTITPASGFVGPGGALVIGLVAGVVCFYATQYIKNGLGIDDSLDVFPVHGVGGMLGTFLAGIFASASLGVFSGQGYADGVNMSGQVMVQVIGIISTAVYTGVLTFIILKIVTVVTGMRVSEEEERTGLDIVLHDERGYDM